MTVNINITQDPDPEILEALEELRHLLLHVLHKQDQQEITLAMDLSAIETAVAADTAADASIITLVEQIAGQLKEMAESGATDQAALNDYAAQLLANSTNLSEAALRNTPAQV